LGYTITENDVRVLRDMRQFQASFTGSGATVGANHVSFATPPPRRGRRPQQPMAATTPEPQYQGMMWGGVTANEAAFAYPFAVETV
jgi:hypothetical protein